MRRLSAALLTFSCLLASGAALAGGSYIRVEVVSFTSSSASDYTLVVEPIAPAQPEPYPDPYMSHCHRFTVTGTYSRLAGFHLTQPPMVTRGAHLRALSYLRASAASHATIRLGWMGSGFLVANPAEPCVVKSRALALFPDDGGNAVISFYHAI
jgi:hypothetical protein